MRSFLSLWSFPVKQETEPDTQFSGRGGAMVGPTAPPRNQVQHASSVIVRAHPIQVTG